MTNARALVIEDTPEFVVFAHTLLEREGFTVFVAEEGERGVALAQTHNPELVILDITLPGIDGFEVCRQIRAFSDAYIIMVSARVEEIDKVLGLTMGADDYVTKPFSSRELSARIAAMRRRPRGNSVSNGRTFGALTIDPSAREVRVAGEVTELTRIEFELLDQLTREPRRAFSRADLLRHVWGGEWLEQSHLVDVHMANLRRKLGESAAEQRLIKTVRGVGYRFDPPQ